jgi:hypothetical protein
MQNSPDVSIDLLLSSLSTVMDVSRETLSIKDVKDLSPNISNSRIFRVTLAEIKNKHYDIPQTIILKIPDWGPQSLIHSSDQLVHQREQLFFASSLLETNAIFSTNQKRLLCR